jgi:predicted CoA-substrate-specific enzyme activase
MSLSIGIDLGSMGTKIVLFDGLVLDRLMVPTGWNPRETGEHALREIAARNGMDLSDTSGIVLTGYGRNSLRGIGHSVTEITCHAAGSAFLYPGAETVLDIGGQDSKAIALGKGGIVTEFLMNDKCAAGTGRFLQVMTALGGSTSGRWRWGFSIRSPAAPARCSRSLGDPAPSLSPEASPGAAT